MNIKRGANEIRGKYFLFLLLFHYIAISRKKTSECALQQLENNITN